MASEEKLDDARLEASEILSMSDDEVLHLFHRKQIQRRLAKFVRHLDRLVLQGGDDAVTAHSALRRLGFAADI